MEPEINRILLFIILLVVQIYIINYCVNKAQKLNRSKWGWGIFGFFLPVIAILVIQFAKPNWDKNSELNSQEENISISDFHEKANNNIMDEFWFWVGLIFILLGITMLIVEFVPFVDFKAALPFVLIVLGLTAIFRRANT